MRLLNLIIILSVLMLLILVYILWSVRKSETRVFAIELKSELKSLRI